MTPPPATADQLIALNREMAALVRAGVPLEEGLRRAAAGGDLPERLSQRMQSGATLPAALAAEGDRVPAVYRAVVEAGLRSGRLPEALESVAALTESLQDLRRRVRTSLIYPAFVVALAYVLFVGFIVCGVPQFVAMQESMRLPSGAVLPLLQRLHDTAGLWSWSIPLAALGVWFVGEQLSRGGTVGPLGLHGGWTRWLPGAGAVRRNYEHGWFCQLLAALIEHQTPLPEALELTAATIGDPELQSAAQRLAAAQRNGQVPTELPTRHGGLTPLVQWLLTGGGGADLATSLRRSADLLLNRARRQAEWFQLLAPVLALVFVGGGAVLTYTLAVFSPLVDLLERLTIEPFH